MPTNRQVGAAPHYACLFKRKVYKAFKRDVIPLTFRYVTPLFSFHTYSMKLLKKALQALTFASLLVGNTTVFAGTDISGPVQRLHLASDGTLWFSMDTTNAQTFCKPGWFSLTMYVPASHPQYQYYYGILMTAVAKGRSVMVANISHFNGTESCDITKTSYGLVLLGP